jgi:release factor glutamine methyltransferase
MADTAAALLARARQQLQDAGLPSPALDARLLLQEAAGLSHADLIGGPETVIGAVAAQRFASFVARRLDREPVSKIIGIREFYGRRFAVSQAVLDPRPDTETLIDAGLFVLPENGRLLDLGTGSGAIAITLLAERPDARGDAVDISPKALAVARGNAQALGVAARLGFIEGNWFDTVTGSYDLIVSNPPYIPAGEIAGLAADVRDFDPLAALDGGPDGLEADRRIAAGAAAYLHPDGSVLVEIGAGQGDDVQAIFAGHGFGLRSAHTDLAMHIRCLCFGR